MLKVGLVGLGFMGRMHLRNYERLEREGYPIQVTAICDLDEKKFQGIFVEGNLQSGGDEFDLSRYRAYHDFDRMLAEEEFDIVDIAMPSYLHEEMTVKALGRGLHVLCEKPMALSTAAGRRMLEAAEKSGRKLMIAQVLRFWPEYEYLKETVESGRYGRVLSAHFFRGGNPPKWTYNDWMVRGETSGGGLYDLHIHDIDMVNWLFGTPQSVSTQALDVLPGSTFDIISTHYAYPDRKVVSTQCDRTLQGEFGFEMSFRVNFEGGNLVFEKRTLRDNPKDGKGFVPELSKDTGYYREIRYFADAVLHDLPIERSTPADSLMALAIAEAEARSAVAGGEAVDIA
ncbi:Gfo/Idh/MocA family protein [Paenibacillus flagellatus]|uniref:Gfo/Idh/MocA family oxidoreductase n=1 Tax=Paenibacillus flagellatus TaxID=2211139 RepID=A0A2V5K7X5_9BACL|nr:Gfo/Idh/MocA family oxidoreductase [Paenibacillus flagellatus]PYI55448.1 gfo/Idh/MocA family oxidoreductase [Paenibacillus flagellatus]